MTQVRTTFTPGEVHEVDGAELTDLVRQGLLHSHELDDDAAAEAGIPKSAHKWKAEGEEPKPKAAKPPKPKSVEPVAPDTFENPDGTVVTIPTEGGAE